MQFRKSLPCDITEICRIIEEAKIFLAGLGIDQWQNGYPNKEVIENDIKEENSYVLVKNSNILATASILIGEEPTYAAIYEGEWSLPPPYAVIHRMAVNQKYGIKNLGTIMMQNIEEFVLASGITNIRVDTHEKNIPMQKMLNKRSFSYCGIIYLYDNSKRVAFEKNPVKIL